MRIFFLLCAAWTLQAATEADLRKALLAKTGKVTLPEGVIEISREVALPPDVHDLEITGNKTTIKAATAFRGRALLVLSGGSNIRIHDVSIDGNRDETARLTPATPAGSMMSRFVANNGILAENVNGFEVAEVKASHVAGFSILVNASHKVVIHDVEVNESGGYNLQRKNSGTGGILLEEGTTDFSITRSLFGKIRGNAITTRSIEHSPVNARGRIAQNEFALIAKDAVQLADATEITVEDNRGRLIGYPVDETDISGGVLPAAVHTVKAVAKSAFRGNMFDNIDGRCFLLTGLADSTVNGNSCSEELFGAILLSGSNNRITGNRLLKLNLAHKESPELLSAGIYLDAAAKNNQVSDNEIAGFGISRHCVVSADSGKSGGNQISKNDCSDEAAVAMLLRGTLR